MNVIKNLRHRFILLATLAVFIIIAGALSLVNSMAYYAVRSRCIDTLYYISQNGGVLPSQIPESQQGNTFFPFLLPGTNFADDSPEFPHQIRYFSLHIDSEGNPLILNVKNISAFSEEQAVTFAKTAYALPYDSGFLQRNRAHYAFLKTTYPNGTTLISILDCTREFADIHTFMNYSLWFGFICLFLYVLIFAFLSNRAIAPFVRNMENQKRFITNASHELKTPLAIISVNAEAMEMINGKNQWTEGILKQVNRLTKLVNQLILLSKAGESNTKLTPVTIDLPRMLQGIHQEFLPLAKEQKKDLTLSVEKGLSTVNDEKFLNALLRILMDNAVKYCDEGGTVSISCSSKKKEITLAVTNDYAEGKNIDYSKFFERFYRNDESHNNTKAGYGIGLSIAEELSNLLSAPLSVSYAEGKITFAVTLKK